LPRERPPRREAASPAEMAMVRRRDLCRRNYWLRLWAEGDDLGRNAPKLWPRSRENSADLVVAGRQFLRRRISFAAESGANAAIGILDGLRLVLGAEGGVRNGGSSSAPTWRAGSCWGATPIGGRDGTIKSGSFRAGAVRRSYQPVSALSERTPSWARRMRLFGQVTEAAITFRLP